MRLSIFWRLALGSLTVILVVAGVNLYALIQLRRLTELSTEFVSYHYPAIGQAKRLTNSLLIQLREDKKFLVARDTIFLKDFEKEAKEFQHSLAALQAKETAPEGRDLLEKINLLHHDYQRLFRRAADQEPPLTHRQELHYERQRDAFMTQINETLTAYAHFHETQVSQGMSNAEARSAQAKTLARRLTIVAILLGLGFAGVASYSILRPLRQIQEHIRRIGQGNFGKTVTVVAPSDLRELVDTVNWMGEKLQELDEMKSEFIANISHDLRTPLASIQEGTRLLLDEIPGSLSKAQRETLQIMKGSSDRLIQLISTLLDLSKMEAGLMEYQFASTDFLRVAQSSVNKVQLLAKGKHIQVLMQAPSAPLWIHGDASQLEQVLDNLLSNALKFSPDGTVVILRIEPDPQAGILSITVSDAGPGIPTEDLPHLFDRFFQGRTHTRHPLASSGLGLAVAKKVVEAHGGRIWVESEVGKGTTVHFLLPIRQDKETS